PVADALGELASKLGYDEIHRVSDPPAGLGLEDHVVVCSGGRAQVARVLRAGNPGYLGMVAGEKEAMAALLKLAADGVPREQIDGIAAPAGLPVGAETPDEQAIAIAAELVSVKRRKGKN